jgi:hypothetical protein
MVLKVIDGAGAPQNLSTTLDASGNLVGATSVTDPVSGQKLTVNPSGAAGAALVSSDGAKSTYRFGTVAATLFSTAAAVLLEIVGSATKTVRVKKITIWAQAATKFYAELTLLRCTGVSSGTPAALNKGKHDISDVVGTAVVNIYQAAAPAGSGSVVIGAKVLTTTPPSASMPALAAIWDFSTNQDKALILRGVGDVIEVANNTLTLGAGTFGCEVELEEDNS